MFTFDKVNNLIIVDAPTTEITIQELINAIRDWEDEPANMELASLAEATGKADLGGGLLVGITLKLLNWKLKFEDRPGPDTILCDVSGGNLVAVDENNLPVNPIEPSSYITVTKTSSVAAGLIAEWSQSEKDNLFDLVDGVKGEVWSYNDRRLTSRDVVSPLPGESLPSEEQVLNIQTILDTIKGLGFKSEEDALRVIRQLIEGMSPPAPKAHIQI